MGGRDSHPGPVLSESAPECGPGPIQEHIKRPLAEELLFGKLEDGGHVRISVAADDTLKLNAEPILKELEHLTDEY